MKNANPIVNTGVLIGPDNQNFMGSCFVFRHPNTFLTAAHCVKDIEPSHIQILLPLSETSEPFNVVSSDHHPTADIALIKTVGVKEHCVTWP